MQTASLSTETSEAGLNFFLGMHQYVWVEVARRDSLLYYYVRSKAKNLVHTTIRRGNLVRTARCTSFICKIFILEKIIGYSGQVSQ